MTTRFLHRLAHTSADEFRARCLDRARMAAEAVRYVRGSSWRRGRLRLVPCSKALEHAIQGIGRDHWAKADADLRAHFLQRAPRFLINPQDRDRLAAAIRQQLPSSTAEAVQRAAPLLEGRYDLLGYERLSFERDDTSVDWHLDPVHNRRAPRVFWARVPYLDPRCGDHKIIWELNRHQHWLALGRAAWLTGDSRYASAFVTELESWLRANPPLVGINWSSMLELAFRSISWIWALHFFVAFEADSEITWLLDLLTGLEEQLNHVSRHLSFYFSPNTHLLGEGLSLYVAGRVLPELQSAAHWERIGRAILLRQVSAQVRADGGHAEQSLHYHRYALDFYLLALAIARRTGDGVAGEFEEVVSRLASFARAVADDDGRLSTIGDDDGGLLFPICRRTPADASDSLSVAAALLGEMDLAVSEPREEAVWMLGGDSTAFQRPQLTQSRSQMLRDSGYAVLRFPGEHAIVDAGAHGFLNGGHAHSDALSLVLTVERQPLLIDPGTATYTMDPKLRDRFRSTPMHNTVVVDGRSQSVSAGPFQWASRANADVTVWHPAGGQRSAMGDPQRAPSPTYSGAKIDYVEAEHDGYLPLVHRRGVLRVCNNFWLVADHLLGSGHHHIAGYWHLDSAWISTEQASRFKHPLGLVAAIESTASGCRVFHGDADGLGWCAPIYGRVIPSVTLRFSEAGEAPLSMVTAIAAARSPECLALHSAPLSTEPDDGWHRVAVTGTLADSAFVAIFATPGAARLQRDVPASGRRFGEDTANASRSRSVHQLALGNGEFVTDARVALLQFAESGAPSSLDLIDASVAIWTGSGAFKLPRLAHGQDMHLDRSLLSQLSALTPA